MLIALNDRLLVQLEQENKKTKLIGLYFDQELVTETWTEIVDFMEIYQSFLRNHLDTNEEYHFKKMLFRLEKDTGRTMLVSYAYGIRQTYDKLEAARLVHKLNRVLARTELLQ